MKGSWAFVHRFLRGGGGQGAGLKRSKAVRPSIPLYVICKNIETYMLIYACYFAPCMSTISPYPKFEISTDFLATRGPTQTTLP